ncbi:hypothetical protein ACFYTQ_28055 [Nocardia sp. NPDC004068]|uniref:hypothetical protein n=1 Tax=Nocardia sp. NPDC004068 TaxID=3364303 RepID=UPI00367C5AD2
MEVVSAAFDRLADHRLPADLLPLPLPVPGADAAGGWVESWAGLRALLWDRALPIAAVDAIWARLIGHARGHGGDATLVCAGSAVPMLAGMASLFAAPGSRDRHDVEADVLAGFLAHLGRVELEGPGLWHRLRWAAYRAADRAARHQPVLPLPDLDRDLDWLGAARPVAGARPGHPEAVLAEAVAAGVLSPEAAELIAESRWERRTLTSLARARGQSPYRLRKLRRRAEHALLPWLTDRARDLGDTHTVEAQAIIALPDNPAPPTPHSPRQREPHAPTAARPRTGFDGYEEVRACA